MEDTYTQPRSASLFSPVVLFSLIVLFLTMLSFKSTTVAYLGAAEDTARIYKVFMLATVFISFIIFLIRSGGINKSNLFLWFAVFYAFAGVFSTVICGLFPMVEIPFRGVRLSYWAWVMIVSYYAVLSLNSLKIHVFAAYIFLPILFIKFYHMMDIREGAAWGNVLALNPVFYISFLLPAILLVRSKVFRIGGVLLIFVAVLMAYKRSAIFAFITSIPVYVYARSVISAGDKMKKVAVFIVGGTLALIILFFVFNIVSGALGLDWAGRLGTLTETGGSGRMDKYLGYLSILGSQSIYEWIVGHGYATAQYTALGSVHNDFLEVLYDFGLAGLMFYLLFIFQLVKIYFDMKRCKYRHFDAFAVSLVIFIWGAMFSMLVIVPDWFLHLAFFWGWVIADFHNAKRYGDPQRIGNPLYVYADYGYEYEGSSEEYTEPIFANGALV